MKKEEAEFVTEKMTINMIKGESLFDVVSFFFLFNKYYLANKTNVMEKAGLTLVTFSILFCFSYLKPFRSFFNNNFMDVI